MKKLLLLFLVVLSLLGPVGCAGTSTPPKPVVLLTDYGTSDYNVPRLKGQIYNTSPDSEIIDATHSIPAMNVAAGAFVLGLTAREFPSGVVFLAVVGANPQSHEDRYLVVKNEREQIFVAPDNGLLTHVALDSEIQAIYQISNPQLFAELGGAGQTAYSLLGPVSARVASGYPLEKVGTRLGDIVTLDIRTPEFNQGKLNGSVVFVDNFGNCLTNIRSADFAQMGLQLGDKIQVSTGDAGFELVVGTFYSSVPTGENVAFINAIDRLELAVNYGNMAASRGLNIGDPVEISGLP